MIIARLLTGAVLGIVATVCIFEMVSSTIDMHRKAMRSVKYMQYGSLK